MPKLARRQVKKIADRLPDIVNALVVGRHNRAAVQSPSERAVDIQAAVVAVLTRPRGSS